MASTRELRRRTATGLLSTLALVILVGCGTPGASAPAASHPSGTVAPPVSAIPPSSPPGLPVAPTIGQSPPATARSPSAIGQSPSASKPCGTSTDPPVYRHVVWIVMENRGLEDVVGSKAAPYLASLALACGLATNYAGVSHPSLPNYIALTSGSTHGIGDDSGPGSHQLAGPSIFSLLGPSWLSLQESMPSACDRGSSGDYAVKHNPAAYYTETASACSGQDVPLGPSPDVGAELTLITPDLCHDMHDCSTSAGDSWLRAEMPLILDSAGYRSGETAVFVVWDENDSGGSLVPAYVVAPSVRPGTRSADAFTHYSLLRTTEELLGLQPLLGAAASAKSMGPPFNL